ncbi:MAG: FUSC family protein [Nocardioidaceae bacterium]|nr:FUSC family protein [Nocardioidaceae bacterium]MDQ3416389.1 FUSC family protein [Actinomycetota bacterium]
MSIPDATWTPRREWRRRTHELRTSSIVIVQICAAATLAWVIATQLAGHPQPFFAPIAAVISVTSAIGHRRWILVELAAGVAIGILVGELFLGLIGRGSWQLALVIVIAASVAVLLDIGRLATIQACTSAILLVTVVPTAATVEQIAVDRFVDALIGGAVGLLVSTALAPDPVAELERDANAVLGELADLLGSAATALRWGDPGVAWTALQQGRALEGPLRSLGDTAASSEELARISPLRWRQREHVLLYTRSLRYVDHAVRDARVLTRRIDTMLRRGYTDGVAAAPALQQLAGAVRLFADDLAEQDRFDEVRQTLVAVARRATDSLTGDASLGLTVVVAQTRALAADLLYATGTTSDELDQLLD